MTMTTEQQKFDLINLVKEHPCIWNQHDLDYKNIKKRRQSLKQISESMDIPVEECRRIWTMLRGQYTRELSLLKSTADGTDDGRSWKFFQPLDFLRVTFISCKKDSEDSYMFHSEHNGSFDEDLCNPSSSNNDFSLNMKTELPCISFEDHGDHACYHSSSSGSHDNLPGIPRKRRRMYTTPPPDLLNSKPPMSESDTPSYVHKDPETLFGEYVAASLRSMNQHERELAKLHVQHVLYVVQCGNMTVPNTTLDDISIHNGQ